ncbi:glycosyltransferase family 2 protein [Methylococcus sp. ANG]|uniref:glycosyltransferase family 2 protein n=1 Tax=Methylococcus sp. ANG TaxID=3231903 RepID=UPI00345A29E3
MELREARLTVVILTRNEERNIRGCLQAVPPGYPVVVLDSGSTDRTLSIAKELNAIIHESPWKGFAVQRNHALTRCGISSSWVLFVDADERYSPEFFHLFENSLASRSDFDVGMLPSLLVFKGKVLLHAPGYPIYHPRLVRTSAARFKPNHEGHGEAADVPPNRIAYFPDAPPYLHYFYEGDIERWLHKHVSLGKAGTLHALDRSENALATARGRLSRWVSGSFWAGPLRFLYHYVLKAGFLDGRAGLEYSLMYGWYEYTKWLLKVCQSGQAQEDGEW